MLSERIFPTFPSEILPENASTLAYGPHGTIAIATGSLINFAFISNHDKSSNNLNLKEIKPMFSISVGLNLVTALKFDTSKHLCADPILYIGDSAGNIFIYNYQKHEYLAVFSPNGHWKDDRYVHVQQIEIDYLPDSRLYNRTDDTKNKNEQQKIEQGNNNSNNIYKNKNIIVLFKSKKIVSYSIIQEDGEPEQLAKKKSQSDISSNLTIQVENDSDDSDEHKMEISKNNSSYNNSFYKSPISNSIDSISSALSFSVNWVIDLENEMTNFSIDPFTNKKIFLYNKNKDNSFIILSLELINGSFSSISSSQTENSEETKSNQVIPKISFSSSLNKYNFKSDQNSNFITPFTDTEIIVHRYSTIQCVQFSRHIQGHVYILTEHELILYNIDLDLFTRVNLTNLTSQKSAHFDKMIQFETDHRKILLVYKTGAMALFSLNSLFTLNSENEKEKLSLGSSRRRRSVSDFKPSDNSKRLSRMSDATKEVQLYKETDVQINSKVHARDDHDVKFPIQKNDSNESKRNFSFKAISEVKQVVQSQQFVNCASPPFESDRDDIIVFLYHPFGIALFDVSRMKIVSCCPLFSDKTICYSTNEKFVAYGSCQGNIRIRSIFDNSFFFSLHVLDDPIKFISISNKFAHNKNKVSQINEDNGLNGIHVYFASDKKIGEFCFDTRKLSFFRSPSSFSIKKAIGSHSGGLIVQRDDETAGVFVKGNEVFLSLPENDKIIDICFNDNENNEVDENDENFVGQDERGSFMILRKNNIVELYKYNKYSKYSFTDNNYNCSNFNFLNDNRINNNATTGPSVISAAAMKRRIIAHLNPGSANNINSSVSSGKNKEKEKETKFAESTCVSLSGVDYALGFNDGSVFLLKTDDQTYAKRVEVLSSIPIVKMKYCNISNNNKVNRVLFCLTGDQILCEVNLLNEEITSKVTISHVEAFSIINSSFIMVKNETNNFKNIDNSNNNSNSNNGSNSNNNNNTPSNSSISSISSKSNLIGINNNNDENKTNFLTPYDDDLIYPFPVISKYKKVVRNRNKSILNDESSSSTEEKEKEFEIEEDSSYTVLEKSLSFPNMKENLKQFIINNPLPKIIDETKESNQSIEKSIEKLWFLLLPSIYDASNRRSFYNYLLSTNKERIKKSKLPVSRFGSPLHLPYSTDFGRDFWLLLLRRSSMRQECLYASGEESLEYEIALSRILEGVASLSTSTNIQSNTSSSVRHSLTHHHLPTISNHRLNSNNTNSNNNNNTDNTEIKSSPLKQQMSVLREKKYRMNLFYALIYAHRYDEATNALTYNPDSDTFMSNTILAAALLGFSEFNISSSKTNENETETNSNSNSIPSLKTDSKDTNSLSMSAREQQYAMIKHAATQMIMLSTVTGRLVEGANLLRLSQLDSFAASILIRAGRVDLAMKFIRGMNTKSRHSSSQLNRIKFQNSIDDNEENENSGEKDSFCFEIGAKCYSYQYFKEAAFFFLTANENYLALLSFFMFAKNNFKQIFEKSPNAFNIHFASAICDIFFLKMYLIEAGLFVEPLLCEKDENLRKKKIEKLGNSNLFNLSDFKDEIDREFKVQISHLLIDENLFFMKKED